MYVRMCICTYVYMFVCACFNCGCNEESMVTHSAGHTPMHDAPCGGVKMLSRSWEGTQKCIKLIA